MSVGNWKYEYRVTRYVYNKSDCLLVSTVLRNNINLVMEVVSDNKRTYPFTNQLLEFT